jgi:glutamine---fructose-6-phosphate transaminase (isomerizing)
MESKEYHFIRELREQPAVARKSLEQADEQLRALVQQYTGQVERVVLTGCGDPYIIGIAAAHALETWANVLADSIEAADLVMYRSHLLNERTLVVLITSSGKTVKVIDAARLSAQRGAASVALTNLVPSPITDETRQVIHTQAGWSDAFPTKQTTTALALLYALALHWAEANGADDAAPLRQELFKAIPAAMEQVLSLEGEMQALAARFLDAPIYTFIGSGPHLTTAMLGAAKMKETSQSRAEASNLEEYGHLHALSLKDGDPIFIVTGGGPQGERNRLMAHWIDANGGYLIVVGPASEREAWSDMRAQYIAVPDHTEMFGPLVSVLPLQMFAYYVAVGKGRNPDRPPERGEMGYLQRIIYTSMLEGWESR